MRVLIQRLRIKTELCSVIVFVSLCCVYSSVVGCSGSFSLMKMWLSFSGGGAARTFHENLYAWLEIVRLHYGDGFA